MSNKPIRFSLSMTQDELFDSVSAMEEAGAPWGRALFDAVEDLQFANAELKAEHPVPDFGLSLIARAWARAKDAAEAEAASGIAPALSFISQEMKHAIESQLPTIVGHRFGLLIGDDLAEGAEHARDELQIVVRDIWPPNPVREMMLAEIARLDAVISTLPPPPPDTRSDAERKADTLAYVAQLDAEYKARRAAEG